MECHGHHLISAVLFSRYFKLVFWLDRRILSSAVAYDNNGRGNRKGGGGPPLRLSCLTIRPALPSCHCLVHHTTNIVIALWHFAPYHPPKRYAPCWDRRRHRKLYGMGWNLNSSHQTRGPYFILMAFLLEKNWFSYFSCCNNITSHNHNYNYNFKKGPSNLKSR